MKGKDEIKELFQKELGNYQAKVDPNLWNGIQAGLGTAGAASGIGSSLGIVGKVIIGGLVAGTITLGSILIVNNNKQPQEKTGSIYEVNSNDSVEKESTEKPRVKEEGNNGKLNSETNNVEKASEKELVNTTQHYENQEKIDSSSLELVKKSNKKQGNNSTSQVNKKSENKIEETTVDQDKSVVPTTKTDQNREELNTTADLSQVRIQIVKQNNQYVSFSAVDVPSNAIFTWNFGDGNYGRNLNPEHFYAEAGIYNVVLTVQTETEEITRNSSVEIQLKGEIENLPNVFTPNGDGRNDEFFIECKHLKSFQLTVMDNHQKVVYSTNDTNFRWNGIDKNGYPVKEGNYIYIIVAEDEAGNSINKYQRLHIQR